jgi:multidrug transporter EmrE-like cation transporter
MERYLFIPFGVITSAFAQIMLKRSSSFQNWSRTWFIFIILSSILYLASFVLYFNILKYFPISRIYPIMTACVIIIISGYGFIIGEPISIKYVVGIVLGILSIFLLSI